MENDKSSGDDDIFFDETDTYGSKDARITRKSIVLHQYHRCCLEGSKCLTLNPEEEQAEIFCNSVQTLKETLYPERASYYEKKDNITEMDEMEAQKADIDREFLQTLTKTKNDLKRKNIPTDGWGKYLSNIQTEYLQKKIRYSRKVFELLTKIMKEESNFFEEKAYAD